VVWADTHGAARAKTMTVPGFLGALQDGCATTVATTTLDASGARTFSSFVRGGGMGLDEMTGSPNIVIVPDPGTFRVLPWAPETGWVLGDEYFTSGAPFHFSPRQLLRRKLEALAKRGLGSVIGLEVEWYLLRVADERLSDEHIGRPGIKGRPLRTHPAEPGYSLHSESNFDLIEPVVSQLGTMLEQLGHCGRSRMNGAQGSSNAPSRRARRSKPPTTTSCFGARRARFAAEQAISRAL
jgi:glutamine synthetase